MNEMKIVCSARPLVIVLAVVLVMCVVCGTAAAEVRYTYVDTFPTGGDRNVHVTSSLKEALESPDFDVVVVTKDITITDNIVVNGSKTLISYYPAGTEINANSAYITIPSDADLTLGTGMNEVNIHGANGDAALFLVDGGTLTMKDQVKLYGNNARNGVIKVTGAGYFHMEGGEITQNTLTEWGSAVYIESADLLPPGVRFRMSGGNISSNTARLISGGVYIGNNAEFIMNGGAIYGNTGYTGGGVLVGPGGKFTQNYGTIAENNADRSMGYGGG
ncbi:MAG: hypothetical protein Q4Q04_03480, partial [Methanocorpusculum sp.]|nr:hypothetical protein [Methanocorpusculum sp.]